MAAFEPGTAGAGVYQATKWGLRGWSHALYAVRTHTRPRSHTQVVRWQCVHLPCTTTCAALDCHWAPGHQLGRTLPVQRRCPQSHCPLQMTAGYSGAGTASYMGRSSCMRLNSSPQAQLGHGHTAIATSQQNDEPHEDTIGRGCMHIQGITSQGASLKAWPAQRWPITWMDGCCHPATSSRLQPQTTWTGDSGTGQPKPPKPKSPPLLVFIHPQTKIAHNRTDT